MIASIKSEFRKLFTVRSTYFITALALSFVTFYAFYIEGYKAGETVANPGKLASEVIGAIGAVSIFNALIALLLLAHEYRYNTIMYTLTSSNSRAKTLFAKIFAVTVFALIFAVIVGVYAPFMTYLGLHLKGLTLVPQVLNYGDLIWKTLFTGWSFAMIGLLLAALIRSQVGAITALFLIPSTVETILSLFLKKNAVYLPFMALNQVTSSQSSGPADPNMGHLSPGRGALVFGIYLLVGWLIAFILFLRRDAN